MSIVRRFLALSIAFCALFLAADGARAQGIIRDAEIEHGLRVISDPLFKASDLDPAAVRIIIIGDDTVNAFVAGGQNLFIYTGLILETQHVGELAGVIAHEAGHIAGGHLVRLRQAMERASTESILSAIAGLAVGVGTRDGGAGMATVMGGSEYAKRVFLRHSRTFESSADQAGMATLERAGLSARGMASFLDRLSTQEILPELQRSPYVLTHPLSRERMNAVQSFVERSKHKDAAFPPEWIDMFDRMRAKIIGFTQPARALREYGAKKSVAARYAVAIAEYRQGNITGALQKLTALQKQEPDNPYFHEMRGQILFEQGRNDGAIAAYEAAVKIKPKNGLLNMMLAQALLQNDIPARRKDAIAHLLTARDHGEGDTPMLHRLLATAYGRDGQDGLAKLALAEEALLKRDLDFAADQATRAKKLLAGNAPAIARADDILARIKIIEKQKK